MLPCPVGGGDAHQGDDAVEVTAAPDGVISTIEDDVAQAGVLEQAGGFAGVRIQAVKIAPGHVVGGVEKAALAGIPGQGSHGVAGRTLDLFQAPDAAIFHGDGPHVRHDTRIVEGGKDLIAVRVPVGPGHGAQSLAGEVCVRSDRVGPDLVQVLLLKAFLEGDPFRPHLLQRFAKNLFELS